MPQPPTDTSPPPPYYTHGVDRGLFYPVCMDPKRPGNVIFRRDMEHIPGRRRMPAPLDSGLVSYHPSEMRPPFVVIPDHPPAPNTDTTATTTPPRFAGHSIYLAGPITGHDNYRGAFARWGERAAATFPGGRILNPADLPYGWTQAEYLETCLGMVRRCQGIVMLPGWERSRGACLELAYAQALGLWIYVAAEPHTSRPGTWAIVPADPGELASLQAAAFRQRLLAAKAEGYATPPGVWFDRVTDPTGQAH